mmetsp:Transcript_16692/g.39940  ORF Transcript_16692/g.39940 Transcript_16692/m.39940 type:complete len:283 (+) Transcript_16692:385-1233(+)
MMMMRWAMRISGYGRGIQLIRALIGHDRCREPAIPSRAGRRCVRATGVGRGRQRWQMRPIVQMIAAIGGHDRGPIDGSVTVSERGAGRRLGAGVRGGREGWQVGWHVAVVGSRGSIAMVVSCGTTVDWSIIGIGRVVVVFAIVTAALLLALLVLLDDIGNGKGVARKYRPRADVLTVKTNVMTGTSPLLSKGTPLAAIVVSMMLIMPTTTMLMPLSITVIPRRIIRLPARLRDGPNDVIIQRPQRHGGIFRRAILAEFEYDDLMQPLFADVRTPTVTTGGGR